MKNSNKNQNQPKDNHQKKSRTKKLVPTMLTAVAFGLCASAIVGLSVALYYSDSSLRVHEAYQLQMESVYSRAYYDLLDGANTLGVTLRKLGVSSSPKMQQSLLYEVWGAAELAESNLGAFEGADEGFMKAQKFVNQLGDYSRALALRVANGQPLSLEERQKLAKLGKIADEYQSALRQVQSSLDEGKLFVSDEGGVAGEFASAFESFKEPSVEYPEMIYDGPFSDALEARDVVGLVKEEIDEATAQQKLQQYFANHDVGDVQYLGQTEGDIETYNYTFSHDGESAFAQISKRGGMLIAFNVSLNEQNTTSGDKSGERRRANHTCLQAALQTAKECGYEDMCVVWSSAKDGECFVNLAPMQNGVILYPDLVKVKVRESDNVVIGIDAAHYVFNHTLRDLPQIEITKEQARQNLSLDSLTDGRLSLIPMRGTKEVLCYEFECESDGTYFIYIDAVTGEEVNILYVISDDMGERTI